MNDFQTLSSNKRIKLLAELKEIHLKKKKQERWEILIPCPFCGSSIVHKNGKRKDGTQTFVCVNCRKAYNERTGTCFHNVKQKEKMKKCIQLMSSGYMSVSEMAEALDMSVMTAFNWRHKILMALVPEEGDKNVLKIEVPFYRKGNHDSLKSNKKRQRQTVRLVKGDNKEMSASIQDEFREWMQTEMKGVSGKYLDHYAAWFGLISESVNPLQVDEILEKVMNLRKV